MINVVVLLELTEAAAQNTAENVVFAEL